MSQEQPSRLGCWVLLVVLSVWLYLILTVVLRIVTGRWDWVPL